MKRLKLLVAPLLVLPFVIACNNGGGQDPVIYHTLKFVSDTCYMKDDIGGAYEEKQFEAGETATFHLDPHEGYFLPLENQVHFKDTKTDDDFTGLHSYNPENGDISVKMTADVTICAESYPITPTTYDEIQIPNVDAYKEATLHADKGIIVIKITNATTISPTSTNFNAASCNLSDESSYITTSTPKVFSTVKMSYDQTTEESLPYDVYNEDGQYKHRLQYWSIKFESQPTENNIYIIIALNNNYVSSTGRTIKQNYKGDVSCTLYNQSEAAAGIEIDYDSITE